MKTLLINPIVRIFTTFILCVMFIMPVTKGFYTYIDNFVVIMYWIVGIYVLSKKCYDIWSEKRT